MKQRKYIIISLLSSIFLFTAGSLYAATVISSIGSYSSNNTDKIRNYADKAAEAAGVKNSHQYIKQSPIADSDIAGIGKQILSDNNTDNTTYVLRKEKKNHLGGSLHQNKYLKKFLGLNY